MAEQIFIKELNENERLEILNFITIYFIIGF